MNLKQSNLADQQLIVGSLKVLRGIENKGLTTIKRSVSSLQLSVSSFTAKTENFWKELAQDSVITPVEKKTLKKNWNTITQTYTAILRIAAEKELLTDQHIIDYKNKYEDLYAYLFSTLKIFDDMSDNTDIPNLSEYNKYFDDYSAAEVAAQNVINASSYATIRTIASLDDTGSEGEIVIFRSAYYQRISGSWKKLDTNTYLGIYKTEKPADDKAAIGNFFLATGSFFINKRKIKTTKGILKTVAKKILITKDYTTPKYLYEYTINGWQRISDYNDYHYVIAWNDLLAENIVIDNNIIKDIENRITEKTDKLETEIEKMSQEERPGDYLGKSDTDPASPNYNDYYLYSGVNTDLRKNGTIYKWQKNKALNKWEWVELNSSDVNCYYAYMTSLQDMLAMEAGKATAGLFSTVFAKALVATNAFIESLATKLIELQEGGIIQSKNFSSSTTGFKLEYNGFAQFKGADIKGDTNIEGICNVDKLHFNKVYGVNDTNFNNNDIWMVDV